MAKKIVKAKPAEEAEPDADDESALDSLPVAVTPPAEVSTPARASCLTFVFLFLAVLTTVSVSWWRTGNLIWNMHWYWFITIAVLVFVIPIVVYRAVSLWLFDEIGRFPDITDSWRAGVYEMRRNGMTLSSAPLFIIIGTGNDKLRRNMMSAADGDFFINGNADPSAPLHWYVNSDGIFLYLNDASWMNAAVSLYEVQALSMKAGRPALGDNPQAAGGNRPQVPVTGTIVPGYRAASPPARPDLPADAAAPVAPPASDVGDFSAVPDGGSSAQHAVRGGQYIGTIVPGQMAAAVQVSANSARTMSAGGKRAFARLPSEQSNLQLQRLETVCGLLRRHRHPLCPINGILTLLPFEMLRASDQDVKDLERAISADLETIYRELQLRCPVTAVVVGMEQERGFRELVRRIGRDGAARQRFGQRFDIRVRATADELRKFTSHVCGTFEDWVYTMFRDEQALAHPGNTALYALLCKVRRTLKTRLGDILGNGFGCDPHSDRLPVLFSGCYFAATGPKADRQAFVSGLLGKLYDEQEDIEWTDSALRDNARRGILTITGWVVCGAILLATAAYYALSRTQ